MNRSVCNENALRCARFQGSTAAVGSPQIIATAGRSGASRSIATVATESARPAIAPLRPEHSERSSGPATFQWVGIVPSRPQKRYKFRRTMGAIDDRRLDPLDAFDKLVKVGVIGKGNRVIDS